VERDEVLWCDLDFYTDARQIMYGLERTNQCTKSVGISAGLRDGEA